MQDRPGLAAIRAEMARQHADARASFDDARSVAVDVARSIRRNGRLMLLGMGGSHWVNRTAAILLRRAGIEVAAEVLSEALLVPFPDRPRTVLLTSQSGGSGEILRYLDKPLGAEDRFGLTLDPASGLASRVKSLVGAGGPERAFAATRSVLVTHALHLAVLAALGIDAAEALAELDAPSMPDVAPAFAALADAESYVLTGRTELQGVAESGALCIMELARRPALALEGGQLRHGPMEMLSPRTGIVLLRPAGPSATLAPDLVAACRAAGCPVVIFDVSGEAPIADAVSITLPRRDGMAAVFAVLPGLQNLLVELAAHKVADVGIPLRSTKVTTEP